jgi:hypothetical protein
VYLLILCDWHHLRRCPIFLIIGLKYVESPLLDGRENLGRQIDGDFAAVYKYYSSHARDQQTVYVCALHPTCCLFCVLLAVLEFS